MLIVDTIIIVLCKTHTAHKVLEGVVSKHQLYMTYFKGLSCMT